MFKYAVILCSISLLLSGCAPKKPSTPPVPPRPISSSFPPGHHYNPTVEKDKVDYGTVYERNRVLGEALKKPIMRHADQDQYEAAISAMARSGDQHE